MKRRSIVERLRRAKSLHARRKTALDWAANWQREHEALIGKIERALQHGDIDNAGRYLGQLKAVNVKPMEALPRVVMALADEDIV